MAGFVPDTSCMVAAVCSWHEHHQRAAVELNRRLASRESMLVAAPALIEAYAVLTRLPPPHRLAAQDAFALLNANFIRVGQLIALDAASYRTLLQSAATNGVTGGHAYDAVIARCALNAKATAIVTFNERHFLSLAPPGIEIVAPAVVSAA